MTQAVTIGAQASALARSLTLNGPSATKIPRLVYGTAWKKDQTADLVYAAIKSGFRGVDTAAQPKHYDEHGVAAGVKRAIAEGIVQREDIYIQTKFTAPAGQNHITPYDINASLADKVRQSVNSSLKNFTIAGQEPYLDSLVLHSPLDTLEETITVWETLEDFVPQQIRNLGISNTSQHVLDVTYSKMKIKPAVVQNRFHERTRYETELRASCQDKGIVFQSFWTLTANSALLKSYPVSKVAEGAGVDRVAAYYSLVLGLGKMVILDGTTNEAHMTEDLKGIEKVGQWAEGEGVNVWASALKEFKKAIREQ
ncbi:hypothetical protein S40293_03311 [Stachybotrys chartarum IBT 40293]|nr:hypothetical protein S40293_03311 [Stachybotrys chartarum IBT 40293]